MTASLEVITVDMKDLEQIYEADHLFSPFRFESQCHKTEKGGTITVSTDRTKSLLTRLLPPNKQQGQLNVIRESIVMVRGQQLDTWNEERTAFLSPSTLITNLFSISQGPASPLTSLLVSSMHS